MADEKRGKGVNAEPFELGRSYDEVEPNLGRLHDAWHVETGRPALRLYPTDRVDWRPAERWEVRVICEPATSTSSPAAITLVVEGAAVPPLELTNVLVLSSAAVTRVEEHGGFETHLASVPHPLPARPPLAVRPPGHPRGHLVAGLALALGGCLLTRPHTLSEDSAEASQDARALVSLSNPEALAVAGYPLPDKPFRNQAVPPCPRRKVVVEINGGCWVEIAQKPPCEEDQAEHQGKCYLPGAKPAPLPRSVEPRVSPGR